MAQMARTDPTLARIETAVQGLSAVDGSSLPQALLLMAGLVGTDDQRHFFRLKGGLDVLQSCPEARLAVGRWLAGKGEDRLMHVV